LVVAPQEHADADFAEPLARLIAEVKRLPGIGRNPRSALRSTVAHARARTSIVW